MNIKLQKMLSFCFAKPTIILMFVFVSVCSLLNAITHHIKQDGTGNFTAIQEGIIAATDNDTILVYPGTYYENIDYLEKSLSVASLYIITPEDSLINQTIIDGNQQARCLKINECENASIIGFTIQNGYALESGVSESYQGGGIFIKNVANAWVSSCKIKDNKAFDCGGLYINNSNVILDGNIISYNRGIRYAGGLGFSGNNTTLQFNETNLNSIYLNYSATGSDIYIGYNIPDVVNIITDTLTVNEPDFFFIGPSHLCTISQLNSIIEPIDQDLYVAPEGDDSNSGLTTYEPLQTLAWAQTLIKRNDENPNTIHLAEGTYSRSLNNQVFPMNIKQGVIYKGISSNNTILDAESEYPFFFQYSRNQDEFSTLILKDLKLTNGECLDESYAGAINIYQADLHLNNVIIENCNGNIGSAILTQNGYCNFNNVIVRNNTGGKGICNTIEYNCPNPVLNATYINTKVEHNYPGVEFNGGAIRLGGHPNILGEYKAQIINCEIIDNYNDFFYVTGGASGLTIHDNIVVDVVNSTFGDNTLLYDTGCTNSVNNSELNIFNSILYNNDGYSTILWENALINISNSLIEGGDDNVNYQQTPSVINWLEGNVNEDPLWQNEGDFPFSLTSNSPCINAGTLDLPPEIELPEFDLAGNPRIYGETIDMGAYEYQGDSQSINENVIVIPEISQISNYPNPFNPSTTIKLDLAESGEIELAIYNIKGQKIKTFLNAYSAKGHFMIVWQGTDDNQKKVASGQYFIKLNVNGKEKAISKCILLK
ncbi:MAG: hypothetical protein DRN27_08230 [Thermoplasmata archaeon]|nr:MAG: hypothetical protein DRJ01_10170 [Bacteroidota bacterium]RLF57198.1 MAG: hypothetical protein DRN27_08230 [Thermoplasmata archaeon]